MSISSLVVWYLLPRSCNIRLDKSNLHLLVMETHLFLKHKVYKCAICKHICQNRKELYSHLMTQHGGTD